jgi:hypothetical protein
LAAATDNHLEDRIYNIIILYYTYSILRVVGGAQVEWALGAQLYTAQRSTGLPVHIQPDRGAGPLKPTCPPKSSLTMYVAVVGWLLAACGGAWALRHTRLGGAKRRGGSTRQHELILDAPDL